MGADTNISYLAYESLQLFTLESGALGGDINIYLQLSRFIAPIAMLYTAILALYSLFRERIQIIIIKLLYKKHVVICGIGNTGNILVNKYLERGCRVVAVEIDAENDHIQNCRENGARVILGDASQATTLKKAKVEKCAVFIATCGIDDANVRVGCLAQEIASNNTFIRNIFAAIYSPKLYGVLLKKQISTPKPTGQKGTFKKIEFYNKDDYGAKVLLDKYYPSSSIIEGDTHVAVVGSGNLSEYIILYLIAKWGQLDTKKKFKITIIDEHAKELEKRIEDKSSPPGNLELKTEDSINEKTIKKLDPTPAVFYITTEDENTAISQAFDINENIKNRETDIIVSIKMGKGISSYFNKGKDKENFSSIKFFGPLEETNDPEYLIKVGIYNILARAIHAKYLINERARGKTNRDNLNIVEWPELSDEVKESNVSQATFYPNLLKTANCGLGPITNWDEPLFADFTEDEIEKMAQLEHQRWFEQNKKFGWKYGKPRNDEKKIHPAMLPWEKLSEEDREKDREAVRAIPENLRLIGYRVYRLEE